MYGKFFASTFTGSMFGAGPDVFAVWGYVIASAVDSAVELNPLLLAATLGTTPERVEEAIAYLQSPDPKSRNPAEDGRRLIKEGGYLYRVVSHAHYKAIRSEDDRRAYNREAQRRRRAKLRQPTSPDSSLTVNDQSAMSAQEEAAASASASDFSEGGVGETLSAAELRRPMTASWQPAPETLAAFEVGMIPDWAVTQLVARFRAHFAANKQDLATDVQWNQRCSKWVFRDWGNPSKQPQKPEASAKPENLDDYEPLPPAAAGGSRR